MNQEAFDGKTLMITGGTGSFGSTVLKHFLDSNIGEIRIFSRDEKKQDDMRHDLQAKPPSLQRKFAFILAMSVMPSRSTMRYMVSTTYSMRPLSSRCRPASSFQWKP